MAGRFDGGDALNTAFRSLTRLTLVAAIAGTLAGCGINTIPTLDEQAEAELNDLNSAYQRRADLIPNLVATVKAAGAQEKSILVEVTQARAAANTVQVSGDDLTDPAKIAQFSRVQGAVGLSLQRLQEAYPELKSQANYTTLMSQLEGTENRINVARNKYIAKVQEYNTKVRSVPTNFTAMIFGYKTKPSFTVANEQQISVPPAVSFEKPASR